MTPSKPFGGITPEQLEESKKNWAASTVSAAGWLDAIQSKRAHICTLDPEEANIAQMLFDAADLDSSHTITFTEFAMLAVLLSATDAHDADAQVRQQGLYLAPVVPVNSSGAAF